MELLRKLPRSDARLLFLALFCLQTQNAASHGTMVKPPQRGVTNGFQFWKIPIYDKWARTDWYSHFPSGDKSPFEGAALASQIKEAGDKGWSPYNPRKPGFHFRTGVCGDLKWKPEHMRGGIYYNKGRVSKTYKQNDAISIDVVLAQHHNGYFQFRVCDVKHCGGEISEACLRGPHCYLLQRVRQESCESRKDWKCAPIDKHDPSRWYLPCSRGSTDFFGGGKMLYQLPKDLHCEHCVLQWYWVAANQCNPPGLERFFKNNKMEWKQCPGQGEARNGWRRWLVDCHGRHFPEEYYQCSDIKILPNKKAAMKQTKAQTNAKTFQKITFYGNGAPKKDINDGQTVVINATPFERVTFRAVTNYEVPKVVFYVGGQQYWTDSTAPYFLTGDKSKWGEAIYNRKFKLQAWADGKMITVFVTLNKVW